MRRSYCAILVVWMTAARPSPHTAPHARSYLPHEYRVEKESDTHTLWQVIPPTWIQRRVRHTQTLWQVIPTTCRRVFTHTEAQPRNSSVTSALFFRLRRITYPYPEVRSHCSTLCHTHAYADALKATNGPATHDREKRRAGWIDVAQRERVD